MIELLKIAYIALGIVGGCVSVAIAVKKAKPNSPCETCEHLVKKGGGMWRYECWIGKGYIPDHFDKPPEYCKNYKPMEVRGDDEP